MSVISRDRALDLIEVIHDKIENGEPFPYEGAKKFIESLPSAQSWTRCKESMPEENKRVLCCSLGGVMFVASYGKLHKFSEEKGWITDTILRFSKEFVEWWAELPEDPEGSVKFSECYKQGGENNERRFELHDKPTGGD